VTDLVTVDGRTLGIAEVEAVARGGAKVVLDSDARDRVGNARRVVDEILASGEVVYGINTGFGKLAEVRISPDQLEQLQLNLLVGSEIRESHRECGRVQDAYSLRCSPQVHGAGRDALEHAHRVLEIELNSATDNPMVFAEGRLISGGNFHGAPIAAVFDYLAATLTDLASISERRLARMVDTSLSGLPRFLSPDAGLNSGFMMVQVSAAALVSECKTLAHPASVDSIPTSAGQEDHVSMSTWAARKLQRVAELTRQVLGMEYLAAVQALEFQRPLRTSPALEEAASRLRERVPRLEDDRYMAPDMAVAAELVPTLGSLAD
jgi:histidine ammonia-lyase